MDYIRRERQILDSLQDEEGIARLHFTFQDAYSLYLGLEHCPNGGCMGAAAAAAPQPPAPSCDAAVRLGRNEPQLPGSQGMGGGCARLTQRLRFDRPRG